MATETKTFYPGEYEADLDYYDMTDATNPVGKGSANTTYASFKNRSYASGIVYWPFDTSIIPAEATIDSVACKAKGSCNNSTKGSMQLYSGTVAKGSATSTNTSAAVYNLSCGTWTRAELDNIRLLTKITNTNSDNSTFYFYGADLTVTYTYQSEKFMLKLDDTWHDVARIFKKVSGIWVEQTDLANVIEDGVRYQNGGEYVAPVQPAQVTITGTGSSVYCYAQINGTKYTSAESGIEVMPGDTITFCACQFYGQYGTVTINGSVVYTAPQQSAGTYTWTVPDGISSINIVLSRYAAYYNASTVTVTTTQ